VAKRSAGSVGARSAPLSVAALEEDDFLRNARGDGRGESALAGGDAGEVLGVALAEGGHAQDSRNNDVFRPSTIIANNSPDTFKKIIVNNRQ
jgi:hypothetical protein